MARRSNAEKEAEDEAIKNWNPRYKHNVIVYLWIYGILGAVTGITNDAALSYYKIVAPHLISGLNIFNAATAILMSVMIATVHKDFADLATNDGNFYGLNLYHNQSNYHHDRLYYFLDSNWGL